MGTAPVLRLKPFKGEAGVGAAGLRGAHIAAQLSLAQP